MNNETSFPTIGILGGGQLGRMSALAALSMGIRVKTLSPTASGPESQIGDVTVGDWNDPTIMAAFVSGCDVVTVESEWAPAELAETVKDPSTAVWPSSETLKIIRHKGRQKIALEAAGIPVPEFQICSNLDEAKEAFNRFGERVVAKKFEGSYDGYGNATVQSHQELEAAWIDLSSEDGLLIESFVPFRRELAMMVARSSSGESAVYPLVWTEQKDHRCHAVTAPSPSSEQTQRLAKEMALAAADAVSVVGLLGVEFFELGNGDLLVNELAPRPHNTGHFTIEACHTSQFENHVRSILDWPLGDASLHVPAAVMVNLLGKRSGLVQTTGLAAAMEISGASIHIYGKHETKPNRKMGHVTVTATDSATARAKAEQAASLIFL